MGEPLIRFWGQRGRVVAQARGSCIHGDQIGESVIRRWTIDYAETIRGSSKAYSGCSSNIFPSSNDRNHGAGMYFPIFSEPLISQT
jgi:hypothetical protein